MNKITLIFNLLAAGIVFFHYFNGYFDLPDDNSIEQAVESLIEDETGISIDFTPGSI